MADEGDESAAQIKFTVSIAAEFSDSKEKPEGDAGAGARNQVALVQFLGGEAQEVSLSSLKGSAKPWSQTYERTVGEDLVRALANAPTTAVRVRGVKPGAEEGAEPTTFETVKIYMNSFLMNRLEVRAATVGGEAGLGGGGLTRVSVVVSASGPVLTPELAERFLPVELSIDSAHEIPPGNGGGKASYVELDSRCKPVTARYSFFGFGADVVTDGRAHAENVEFSPASTAGCRRTFFLRGGKINLQEFVARVEEYPLCIEFHDRDPANQGKEDSKGGGEPAASESKVEEDDSKDGTDGDEKDVSSRAWSGCKLTKSKNMYGVARFRLSDMFQNCELVELSADIQPEYPAVAPKAADLRDPGPLLGRYTDDSGGVGPKANPYAASTRRRVFQAQLNISIRVPYPLNKSCMDLKHPFSRAMFVLSYGDTKTLRELQALITEANVNALSLPDSRPSTLLMRPLTRDESRSGSLDVVTGFQLVDDKMRILVVEGIAPREAGPDGSTPAPTALQRLARAAPLADEGGPLAVLFNPKVTFRHRLYAKFQLTPKTFRLTRTISRLQKEQPSFTQDKSREAFVRCLDKVVKLLGAAAEGIRRARFEAAFPTVHELLLFEKKFGKEVLDIDLGLSPKALPQARKRRAKNGAGSTGTDAEGTGVSSKTGNEMLETRRAVRAGRARPWSEEPPELTTECIDVPSAPADVVAALDALYPCLIQQSSEALSALRDNALPARADATEDAAPPEVGRHARTKPGRRIGREGFARAMAGLSSNALDAESAGALFEKCAQGSDSLNIFQLRRAVVAARERTLAEAQAAAKEFKREVDEEHDPSIPVYTYGGQTLNYRVLQQRRLLAKDRPDKVHKTYSQEFLTQSVDFSNPDDVIKAERAAEVAARTHPKGFQYYVPRKPEDFIRHPRALDPARTEELEKTRWHEEKEIIDEMNRKPRTKRRFNTLGHIGKHGVFGYKDRMHIFDPSVHEANIEGVVDDLRRAEIADAKKRFLGDRTVMPYRGGISKKKPSQLDKNETILKTKPTTRSAKLSEVPHYPHNMFCAEPAISERGRRGYAKIKARPNEEQRATFQKNLRKAQANPVYIYKRKAEPMRPAETKGPKWGT